MIDEAFMTGIGTALREVAEEAILPRFRQLKPGDTQEKEGPHDLVTAADLESERLLSARLQSFDSRALMVGEEAAAEDPTLVPRLPGARTAWILDPVDGTLNFASGLPLFAVILAYMVDGVTEAGWIYDPVRNRLATAVRGKGAFLDGRRLRIPVPPGLPSMHGVLNSRNGHRPTVARMAYRANRIGSILGFRCCAQEYLGMLEGAISFAVYHRTQPWDHLAGLLLHAEAGGFAARIDGERYRIDIPTRPAPLLVAPDEASWTKLRDTFFNEEEGTP